MSSIRKTATDIADRFFHRGLEPERHASLVKAITDAIHTDRMDSSTRTSPVGGWEPPEGFVLVPREPTGAMIDAGNAVGDYPWDGKKAGRVFAAMLAASPAQPGGEK